MSENRTYRTILQTSTSFLKESNSKFYGLAFNVADELEIEKQLAYCRELHPGATHYCFAWRLGIDGENFRANDDGEPGNSAGQPILRQILSKELTHILVVVVRFYGGKKLGIPGLISAYGGAAELALEDAEVIEVEQKLTIFIRVLTKQDYLIYEFVRRNNGELINAPNISGSEFELAFSFSQWPTIQTALKELPNFDWRIADDAI